MLPKKSIPRRRLTIKQDNFARNVVVNGGNLTQAAIAAYPDIKYNSARVIGPENIAKLAIINRIQQIADELGYTNKDATSGLIDGARSSELDTRHKYLSLYFDVTGQKAPQKIENTHKIEYSDEERRELDDLRCKIIDTQVDIT